MAEPFQKQGMRRETQNHITFGQMHQLLLELPKTMNHLHDQTENVQKLMKQELMAINEQTKTSEKTLALLGLIHDRLDALSIEGRVTNYLLAELVAIQQTIITENTEPLREGIRHDAYTKVLSAQ